jgi:hypothetical protein
MNNISTNLAPCEACNNSLWGVELDATGGLSPYCTFCSGDYAYTKTARDAAEALNTPTAE